jgi:hypothetical protein
VQHKSLPESFTTVFVQVKMELLQVNSGVLVAKKVIQIALHFSGWISNHFVGSCPFARFKLDDPPA